MKKELCHSLAELSDLEQMPIKSQAYYKGFRAIKKLSEEEILKRKGFQDIEGIGPSLNKKILEFIKTGKIAKLEAYKAQPSIKKKKSGDIIRISAEEAWSYIKPLEDSLLYLPFVTKFAVCGSLRRKKATVADADILVCTGNSEQVWQALKIILANQKKNVTAEGNRKISLTEGHGFQIDISFCSTQEWGASLLHFTGSSRFNVYCRQIAKNRGWSLNQYGLWEANGVGTNRIPDAETEEEILEKLGLEYEPPEERF